MQQQQHQVTPEPNSVSPPRVFLHSVVEWKDDVEEKLERARGVLGRLVGNASERETHDVLSTAACRDQKTHDDICLGLLGTILIEPALAPKCYRDLSFLNRDSLNVVADLLGTIVLDKYHKLTDVSRTQLIWLIKEMVKGSVNRVDEICWVLIRQIAGGDVSGRNLWLAESLLDVFSENRTWLEKYPVLIAAVIYTFLRIIEDHHAPSLSSLRQKEVNFVVILIREHFTDMCMNQQIALGRDFLRLLQAVSRIPEFELLWRDILYNPRSLSPHLAGITQLLNVRTSRKYLQLRLTPDMEKKIIFLTSHVRFGMQKRYQEWFQRQYFSTPESQTLRADIIRYIVGVIHPSNEILCSDILPRWAVIGWLLTTCTNPVAAANAKLALFFDWLVFDPVKDNIMNIEPGILVMYHSLKPHLAITATLLDFLIRLTYEYWPGGIDKIKSGVGSALRTILEKKVLASLDPVLENPKLEPDLRSAIQEHLIVLLDRNNGSRVDLATLGVNSVVTEPNHLIVADTNVTSTQSNIVNNSVVPTTTTNNTAVLPVVTPLSIPAPALPVPNPANSTSNCISLSSSTTSAKVNSFVQPFTTASVEEPEFSDDNEDEENELVTTTTHPLQRPKNLSGAVPFRSSPTLGSSVEEAEKAKVFELTRTLPSDIRISIEAMLNDTSGSVRSEYLEEIVDELSDTNLDKDIRENVSKCVMYVYKLDLTTPCINEDSVLENLIISPVTELLSILLKLRPSDKSLKMKNLMRLLSDIITNMPVIAYKILILLCQTLENPMTSTSRNEDNCIALYKNLAHYRGLKLESQLLQDIRCCYENEPIALGYLCPILYNWYDAEMAGSTEILHLLVSTLDSDQLLHVVCKVRTGNIVMFDDTNLINILTRSLEWETWEQHCVWTLVMAHRFSAEEFLPIITQLDFKHNSEACTALLHLFSSNKPSHNIVGPLFCRRPNPKDLLATTLLVDWSGEYEDDVADVLAGAIVRATGSPVKRKRGPTGSRGTSSPAGPPTPTVEQVLGHLDQLRLEMSDGGIFLKDIMQAALLQIQSFVTDTQKVRYKELLALAAEEPDVKESRSSTTTKRPTTPRKLPSSPTSSSSSTTNYGGTVSSGGGSSGGASSPLSRTRSGRTRAALKDDSTDTSDDDDDIPQPKRVKRRKNNSALNSDSD